MLPKPEQTSHVTFGDWISAREAIARLDAIVNERDRRMEERFTGQDRAVSAALAAQEKAVAAALGAAERAVLKAETAAEKRFESQNEFRGQLSDQAARQMPREEANIQLGNLRERIDGLQGRVEALTGNQRQGEGKQQGSAATFALIVSIAGFVLTLCMLGVFLFVTLRAPAAPPQVIYTPAPAGTQLPSVPPASVPR